MVEINVKPFDMSEEEVEETLRKYVKSGYRWRINYFSQNQKKYEFYIWKSMNNQNFFVTSKKIYDYFKNLKKLEFGNKEQIEMKKCLDLIAFLLTAQKLYQEKRKFNLCPYIISSEYFLEEKI